MNEKNISRRSFLKGMAATGALSASALMLSACGKKDNTPAGGNTADVDVENLSFPLAETATLTGLINYPAGTESQPNNRTIFKRLEEKTNVHVEWNAIQGDQWGDKIQLEMSNIKTLAEFVFTAGFGDTDLLKFGKQGVIIPVEDLIDNYMPNLKTVFEKVPQYKNMSTATDGHIWALPWIEQLGSEKTAIQLLDNMPFINTAWLKFLNLEMPTTVDEFKAVLTAFRDNAAALKAEFNIDGDVIPMSCIMNDGGQDPCILINGFGEGLGDPDTWKHIAVTNDKQVVCTATQEGFKKGLAWLHELVADNLVDVEAFTQDWSTYVAKGKSGRYGVCFSWDVANVVNVQGEGFNTSTWDWQPLPPLKADVVNVTPDTGSFTSGYDRGRCVITANAKNPALVAAWLDQMYDPFQSPQNNWGTYGEDDDFDIFVLGQNANGDEMLQHAPLDGASPVEVREAEAVGGPLAILDEYYGVYVTTPDDAQYRLDWIKDIYAPNVNTDAFMPNVFMTPEDAKSLSDLYADLAPTINNKKSDWVMNGFTDADWDAYLADLENRQLSKMLEINQTYVDSFYA